MIETIWAFILPGFQAIELYVLQKLGGAFIPAFFIAGAMATFVPKSAIIKYLSHGVKPTTSYPIALVGGGVMSVCACGILPLFQTIYQRGAGVGPAMTFLFAGPAINVIAIVFTYQLLGEALGHARILTVIGLSLLLGVAFAVIFGNMVEQKINRAKMKLVSTGPKGSLAAKWTLFALMMGMVLTLPLEQIPWSTKGPFNLTLLVLVFWVSFQFLTRTERIDWIEKSTFLLKRIVPKLLAGIFVIGILEPYAKTIMFEHLTNNGFVACFMASLIGAILYVGTILGVVAVKGLVGMGMPAGPALALLLAGPTVALPSMFVIVSICGKRIGLTFCAAVVLLSAICGYIFGMFVPA